MEVVTRVFAGEDRGKPRKTLDLFVEQLNSWTWHLCVSNDIVFLSFQGNKPDFKMSEDEDSFLNVKRSLKKRMVKHSTPVDSMLSRTMPSLIDLTNQSIKAQDASKTVYDSPVPKSNLSRPVAQVSLAYVEAYIPHMSPKRLSTVLDLQELNKEKSSGSRAVFSRRRLSTVLASESYESYEEPSDKVIPNVEIKASSKLSEEDEVILKSGPSCLVTGIPGIKDLPAAKNRKKKIDKALVQRKEREWLLRQLKNVQEATEYELTIEKA
ncbi:coiled-coil domain-containing protein 201 [Heliangelus exortis]|uniref:coiled-coil domain-containing protein 201 n=1 Tax=Heliangelus exortis TaxID=472823 RepID=UPI003A940D08